MNIVDEIRNDANALALMADWLGDGMAPVEQDVSNQRASVCVSCKENVQPKWWDRFKTAIAETIRAQIEIKQKIEVGTPWDDNLNMCRCCGCCTRLKVHTPIQHIKNHTSEETMNSFPSYCWIKTESV